MSRINLENQLKFFQNFNDKIEFFHNSNYNDCNDKEHYDWLWCFQQDVEKSNYNDQLMFKLSEAFKHLFGEIIIEKDTSYFMGTIKTLLDDMDDMVNDGDIFLKKMIIQFEKVGIKRSKDCSPELLASKYNGQFLDIMSNLNTKFTDLIST